METREPLMMLSPLIATPCYGGMLCLNYVTGILRLRTACSQIGVPLDFYFPSDSLITRARNSCARYFLEGGWSHLFFIDADIGFVPTAALRLLRANLDLVAGIYRLKDDSAGFVLDPTMVGEADDNGFAQALEAPTGFMCIARGVFDRLADAGVGPDELFDTLRDGERYLSEDYAFCRRWRAAGGRVHVDLNCSLTHQGTKLYAGDFATAVREARHANAAPA